MQKQAFTLAEVLITLAVIGVVASMTIPSMMNSIDERDRKVAWKKIYAETSNLFKLMAQENGGTLVDALGTNDNEFMNIMLSNGKFTATQKCNDGTAGCWYADWKYYNGGDPWDYTGYARAKLHNGMYILFALHSTDCTNNVAANNDKCGGITIDVNGEKGPNVFGKDIFTLYPVRDGTTYPAGVPGDSYYADINKYGVNGRGQLCSAAVLVNQDCKDYGL